MVDTKVRRTGFDWTMLVAETVQWQWQWQWQRQYRHRIYRFWCQSSVAVPVVFAGFRCGGAREVDSWNQIEPLPSNRKEVMGRPQVDP